jgi:hypothetical protein
MVLEARRAQAQRAEAIERPSTAQLGGQAERTAPVRTGLLAWLGSTSPGRAARSAMVGAALLPAALLGVSQGAAAQGAPLTVETSIARATEVRTGPHPAAALGISLAIGTALPRVEDLMRGESPSLSLRNVPDNWRHSNFDALGLDDPKRNLGIHGIAGAAFGYLPVRNQGGSPGLAFASAAAVGVGIELGQSMKPGHRVDLGDIARTAVVGAAIGELTHQAGRALAENGHPKLGRLLSGTRVEAGSGAVRLSYVREF